jgi:hypothetical protein
VSRRLSSNKLEDGLLGVSSRRVPCAYPGCLVDERLTGPTRIVCQAARYHRLVGALPPFLGDLRAEIR